MPGGAWPNLCNESKDLGTCVIPGWYVQYIFMFLVFSCECFCCYLQSKLIDLKLSVSGTRFDEGDNGESATTSSKPSDLPVANHVVEKELE